MAKYRFSITWEIETSPEATEWVTKYPRIDRPLRLLSLVLKHLSGSVFAIDKLESYAIVDKSWERLDDNTN